MGLALQKLGIPFKILEKSRYNGCDGVYLSALPASLFVGRGPAARFLLCPCFCVLAWLVLAAFHSTNLGTQINVLLRRSSPWLKMRRVVFQQDRR